MENNSEKQSWLSKVQTLSEALPYMHRYHGSNIVIKFGGHAMSDKNIKLSFAKDIAFYL